MAKKAVGDVGKSLAYCMKKLGTQRNMTQGDIVRATGLERGYISNLEAGKVKHPRIETIAKVANAFGMNFGEFAIYCEKLISKSPTSRRRKECGGWVITK